MSTPRSIAAFAAAVTVFVPVPAASQTTFQACRVPTVGAIYMIGVAGAPTACLDPSHVEFSWTEGGGLADGSVSTDKLADGAVTSTKLADGAVTASKLAFSPPVLSFAGQSATLVTLPDAPTWADLGSVSIVTSGPGQVVVRAVGSAALAPGCTVYSGISYTSGTGPNSAYWTVSRTDAEAAPYQTLPLAPLFVDDNVVTTGMSRTYYFVGSKADCADSLARSGVLTAVFYPSPS